VEVAGLGVEQVLVGQQGIEDRHDALAVVVGNADVDGHRDVLRAWDARPPARGSATVLE